MERANERIERRSPISGSGGDNIYRAMHSDIRCQRYIVFTWTPPVVKFNIIVALAVLPDAICYRYKSLWRYQGAGHQCKLTVSTHVQAARDVIAVELEDDDDDDEYGELRELAVTNFSRTTFHHWSF